MSSLEPKKRRGPPKGVKRGVVLLQSDNYKPGALLDYLQEGFDVTSDYALVHMIGIDRFFLSKIRHKHIPIGPGFLCDISEITGIPTLNLKKIAGLL